MLERHYDEVEDRKIVTWREECFLGAGYSAYDAHRLALRRDIDRADAERAIAKSGSELALKELL